MFHTGERLKRVRKINGMTQEVIAELLNLDVRTIHRMERNGIPEQRISSISKLLDLEPWVFLDERIDEELFTRLILYPELARKIKGQFLEDYLKDPSQTERLICNFVGACIHAGYYETK